MSHSAKSGRMSVWKLVFFVMRVSQVLGTFGHKKMGCAIGRWYCPYFRIDRSILVTEVSDTGYGMSSIPRSNCFSLVTHGSIVSVRDAYYSGLELFCEGGHTMSKHLESLYQNLLNGKLPHNLSWSEAVDLVEHLGEVQPHGDDEFVFRVGGQRAFFKKPHTHNLGVEEVSRLRKFLKEVGPDAHKSGAQAGEPAQPRRMIVVIDHHAAHVYQDFGGSRPADERKVQPYDPYHFHHHLIHRKEAHYRGERAPEEDSFYEEIAKDITAANEIVLIGHATGKSNAADFLKEYLKTHHPDISGRVIATESADLSAVTEPEIKDLAKRHMIAVV